MWSEHEKVVVRRVLRELRRSGLSPDEMAKQWGIELNQPIVAVAPADRRRATNPHRVARRRPAP